MLRNQTHISHQQPNYGPGPSHMHYVQHGRKRSRPHDDLQLDIQGLAGLSGVGSTEDELGVELTHGRHNQPLPGQYPPAHPSSLATQHHHHRLPNQPPPHKLQRFNSPPSHHQGPPSMVGQEGMPPPAPRPRGPKLKFTPEDDGLLVDLKEKKNLTWKQIADFFPGRSSGTLQVRYCTKLKAKATVWTDEMVLKLRNAIREYEHDRWRIISAKVGNGFSPAACKEKAAELEEQERIEEAQEEDDNEERAGAEHPGSATSEGPQSHLYQ
ncbi:uncharacterized protein PV09_00458 [Verruconis gallopava]|uniref:Myb-like domain-containing protein n=1 Tax=Verruconis gallopava TaxID=253628 RepID=A0A0D1Z9E7_9PEZI|nr:uncharacterized protein PV09_00458 [Verruconis gallopava]KIW09587.1 hypothetical protein PV09_00458 [Verruconis gallopava]